MAACQESTEDLLTDVIYRVVLAHECVATIAVSTRYFIIIISASLSINIIERERSSY